MRASNDGEIIWTQTENLNTIDVGGYSETNALQHPYDVAVDMSGVYVVGDEWWNSSSETNWVSLAWRIEKRSLTDGSLIWAQTDKREAYNTAYGVAVDGTGVYVAGYLYGQPYESRIEKRSLIDGSLIWAQTAKLGREARDVAVDASGVYAVGFDLVFGCKEWRIEKLNRDDGSIIWSTTSAPPSPSCHREPWGIASDGSGVYIIGTDDYMEWRIEKRSLIDGSLIWAQTSNPTQFYDAARGVAVDSSGVYVVGVIQPWQGYEVSRIEKRSAVDGVLVWATTGDYSIRSPEGLAVAVDGHAVYTIGSEYSSSGHLGWRMEKRSLTDGSLLRTAWQNPSGIHDRGYAVAIDSTAVYFAGSEHIHGFPGLHNYQWRIEKRGLGITTTTSTLTSVSTLTSTGTTSATQTQTSTTSAATSTVSTATTTMSVIRGTIYWYDVYGNLCPVAWAQVTAAGEGEAPTVTSSTTDGTYMMWVAPGTYSLSASRDPGFIPQAQNITVPDGGVVVVDFSLQPSGPAPVSCSVTTTQSTTTASTTVTQTTGGLQMQVVSNSTVSGLIFDSTRGILNFTISGPTGTYGFFDATIAKTLLLGQPIVLIDGIEQPASVSGDSNFWYIHVTYSHSEHRITIGGSNTIPEFPPIPLLAIIFILAMIILRRRTKYLTTFNSQSPFRISDRLLAAEPQLAGRTSARPRPQTQNTATRAGNGRVKRPAANHGDGWP